ncbi:hypothetical protein KIM372_17410 [Bombiscardovia nodaiensis]|uniref:Gram-positive cocci surface proteins LPxTG domain-containing protein n=1 Tax=Bombiscardovia nodaiensis TaxID=2932181 RepID=A0ABM8BA91_9BIFI|nr:hypothetical protein KIM372_17410 [Bombiscardovia nodaiensis]
MRIHNENAGSVSLAKRVLGLSVAVLTSAAAFMVAVPGAHAADTFDSGKDNFKAGAFAPTPNDHVTLTVTKYLSTTAGELPTGSVNDAKPGTALGVGVGFILTQVEPDTGFTASDMGADQAFDPLGTATTSIAGKWKVSTDGSGPIQYYGVTDGAGQIKVGSDKTVQGQWVRYSSGDKSYLAASANKNAAGWVAAGTRTGTSAVPEFPKDAVHYYQLTEVFSPYSGSYNMAEANMFPMAYYTHGMVSNVDTYGYLYNLSIFPKNKSSQALAKSASKINGQPVSPSNNFVQTGDTVDWDINYSVADAATAGYLDWPTIDGAAVGEQYLQIVDRLSDTMDLNGDPEVTISYTDAAGSPHSNVTLPAANDWKANGVTSGVAVTDTLPHRSNPTASSSANDFFGGNAEASTNYVEFNFAKIAGSVMPTGAGITGLSFKITIHTKVVRTNDSAGNVAGQLTNRAESNYKGADANTPPQHSETHVTSAGLQFAKVKTDKTPLAGAKFGLTNAAGDKYLYTDGIFDTIPATATHIGTQVPVTATSNSNGVVTFNGIPVLDDSTPDRKVDANKVHFGIREMQAPTGYKTPDMVFKDVDFSQYSGKTVTEVVAMAPDGMNATMGSLSFGAYAAADTDIAASVTNAKGNKVTMGMKNYRVDQSSPISLPLTGGKGIVLLLVVGLAIMGGVLVVRNRKNAARHI